ncbi:hypothetical protein, partial [Mesorhizobium sp. Cs1299R1N3]|uniref:hypothetical protein n=1 Tax=Mesorhizobium sp. Cs1299R1N3 TaxID=3015173 RepID=UPI00301C6EE3
SREARLMRDLQLNSTRPFRDRECRLGEPLTYLPRVSTSLSALSKARLADDPRAANTSTQRHSVSGTSPTPTSVVGSP